jgi:hypothetical protein
MSSLPRAPRPCKNGRLSPLLELASRLARDGGSRRQIYRRASALNARSSRLPFSIWAEALRRHLDGLGVPPACKGGPAPHDDLPAPALLAAIGVRDWGPAGRRRKGGA